MFFNEEKYSLQQRHSQRKNQESLSSILQSTPHSNIVVYVSLHKPKARCTFSGNYRVHVSTFLAGIFKRPNYPFTMLSWDTVSTNSVLHYCETNVHIYSIVFKFKHPYKFIGKLVRNHVTKTVLLLKFYSRNGTLTLA